MRKELFLYSAFLIAFAAFSYLFVDLNLIYLQKLITAFFQIQRLAVTLFFILFILVFFFFYYRFLKNINDDLFRKIILITVAVLFFSYPAIVSYDIFNYIFTSKVLFHYHENPYIIMPIEFKGDPLLLFTHAPNKVALYAPFWIILSGLPFILGFGKFLLILFNFKLLTSLFYIITVYLIHKMSKNITQTAFFALNPLVIFETLISSHNDIVMVFFALLSFHFLQKRSYLKSLISLFLSILIKYATFFLFPVYIYAFFLKFKKKAINWERVYFYSSLLMFAIFYFSWIREEIYPWYGLWFLAFVTFIQKYKFIKTISIVLSFCLLLRYIPFMYLGTYFGATPVLKIAVTFIPVSIYSIYYLFKNKFNLSFLKLR